ncbi:MAG TPA: neutral zinc metallopeptidase [Thermodesulfobacteriota bacterium]|nr:neutral zinc metallopeptidase [Thermodesulfobacteriota bacterium]
MRWRDSRQSDNVEDRRGMSIPRGAKIGGVSGLGLLAVVLIGMFLGIDPTVLLQGGPDIQTPSVSVQPGSRRAEKDDLRDFAAVVLAETEDVWHGAFRKMGRTYQAPTLVLFSRAVESACGIAGSAVGPFYCPSDQKIYLDLSFFEDLRTRFGASGDFAQAYVIAHEVGHHVQTLLGISRKVNELQARVSPSERNKLSMRMELQADCLAGVWANQADKSRQILEAGDLEEALNAASAIGDDRIQRKTQGHVVPDAFTHGSAAQRVRWFKLGIELGNLQACDTFNADRL